MPSHILYDTLQSSNGLFPLVVDSDLKGGFRVVADQASLLGISAAKLTTGMWVFRVDNLKVYRYNGGTSGTISDWTEISFGSPFNQNLNTTDSVTFANVSGNGSGLTNLNASNLSSGIIPAGRINDISHGNLGGGSLHAVVTQSLAGFMSAADKVILDNIVANGSNPFDQDLNTTDHPIFDGITSTDDVSITGNANITGTLHVTSAGNGQFPLVLKSANNTDSVIQVYDSNNLNNFSVNADGSIYSKGNSTLGQASFTNGFVTIQSENYGSIYASQGKFAAKGDVVSIIAKAFSNTQTSNIAEWQNQGGSLLGSFSPSGVLTAVSFVGNGSSLTGLTKAQVGLGNVQNVDTTNAANISTGIIAPARLGTGTANSTTYLRGDGTWQTVPINHTQNTDTGTTATSFQIDTGNTGPRIKNIAGVMTVRNAGDTANANLTAAAIIGATFAGDGSALTGLTKSQVGLSNVANVDTTNAANLSSGIIPAARFDDTTHGNRFGGSLHAVATTSVAGFMSAADKISLGSVTSASHAQNTDTGTNSVTFQIDTGNTGPKIKNVSGIITIRNATDTANAALTASAFVGDGSSLTGLTKAQVGLGNVANVDTTNAANISSGILPAARFDDTTHGNRSGGTLHAVATTSVAGFMSATDKVSLNNYVSTGGNPFDQSLNTTNNVVFEDLQINGDINVLSGNTNLNGGILYLSTDSFINATQNGISINLPAGGGGLLEIHGDITAGYGTTITGYNIVATGNVTASYFLGDGSSLTGLTKSQVGLSNVANIDTTNAANISSGILPAARFNDTTHGNRGGGTLHAVATQSLAGFMSAADKATLDNIVASGVNPFDQDLNTYDDVSFNSVATPSATLIGPVAPVLDFVGDGTGFTTSTAGIRFDGSKNYFFGIGSNLASPAILIQSNGFVNIPKVGFGYLGTFDDSTFGRTEGNKVAMRFGNVSGDPGIDIFDYAKEFYSIDHGFSPMVNVRGDVKAVGANFSGGLTLAKNGVQLVTTEGTGPSTAVVYKQYTYFQAGVDINGSIGNGFGTPINVNAALKFGGSSGHSSVDTNGDWHIKEGWKLYADNGVELAHAQGGSGNDLRFGQITASTVASNNVRGYDGASLYVSTEGSNPLVLGGFSTVLTGNKIDVAIPLIARSTIAATSFIGSGATLTNLNAANLSSGIIPAARFDDTSHGSRSGGTLHAVATTSAAGFMSASDKTTLDNIVATGVNPFDQDLNTIDDVAFNNIDLSGYIHAAQTTISGSYSSAVLYKVAIDSGNTSLMEINGYGTVGFGNKFAIDSLGGRFGFNAAGKITWTDGGTVFGEVGTLALQRSASKTLKLDDSAGGAANLIVTGDITASNAVHTNYLDVYTNANIANASISQILNAGRVIVTGTPSDYAAVIYGNGSNPWYTGTHGNLNRFDWLYGNTTVSTLDSSGNLTATSFIGSGSALTGLTKTQVGLSNVQNVDTTNAANLSSGIIPGVRFDDTSHGNRGGGSLHALATTSVAGFMSAADKASLNNYVSTGGNPFNQSLNTTDSVFFSNLSTTADVNVGGILNVNNVSSLGTSTFNQGSYRTIIAGNSLNPYAASPASPLMIRWGWSGQIAANDGGVRLTSDGGGHNATIYAGTHSSNGIANLALVSGSPGDSNQGRLLVAPTGVEVTSKALRVTRTSNLSNNYEEVAALIFGAATTPTYTNRSQAAWQSSWAVGTDSSYQGAMTGYVYDNSGYRQAIKFESNGTSTLTTIAGVGTISGGLKTNSISTITNTNLALQSGVDGRVSVDTGGILSDAFLVSWHGTPRMQMTWTGSLLIGTTTDDGANKLQVNGGIKSFGTVTGTLFSGSGSSLTNLNASTLSAGIIPSARFDDTTHGNRSGGSLHALATQSVAGFMSAADKTNLDTIVSNGANPFDQNLNTTDDVVFHNIEVTSSINFPGVTSSFTLSNNGIYYNINGSDWGIDSSGIFSEGVPLNISLGGGQIQTEGGNVYLNEGSLVLDGNGTAIYTDSATGNLRLDPGSSGTVQVFGALLTYEGITANTFTGDGSGLTNLNADNITDGTLPAGRFDDYSHGNLSGGALHALATQSDAGFMSSVDKTTLDELVLNGVNPFDQDLNTTDSVSFNNASITNNFQVNGRITTSDIQTNNSVLHILDGSGGGLVTFNDGGSGQDTLFVEGSIRATGAFVATNGIVLNDDYDNNYVRFVTLSSQNGVEVSGTDFVHLRTNNNSNGLTVDLTGTVTVASNLVVGGSISGNGSSLTGLTKAQVGLSNVANVDTTNASNISSGTINTARLGSGTANSTTYLRGDNTWATIPVNHVQNTDTGTTATSFQFDSGNSGPRIKNTNGGLTVRNAGDTANANLAAAAGAFTGDLLTNGKVLLSSSGGLTAALVTEVNGQLINFGSNYNQGGSRDASQRGGFFRIDLRGGGTPLFQIMDIEPNASEAIVFSVSTTGGVTATSYAGNGSALTGLTKAQVGLGNVANVDTTNAANISSGILPAGRFDDTTHGNRSGGTLHAVATTSVAGFMSASDKTLLGTISSSNHTQNTDIGTTATSFQIDTGNTGPRIKNVSGVLTVRNAADSANAALTASAFTGDGSALTGLTKTQVGLSNVQNIDTTNAANISSGILPAARFDDSTHGNRGGGTLHAVATTTVAGFMSAADKVSLNNVAAGGVNPFDQSLNTNDNVNFTSVNATNLFGTLTTSLIKAPAGSNIEFRRPDGTTVMTVQSGGTVNFPYGASSNGQFASIQGLKSYGNVPLYLQSDSNLNPIVIGATSTTQTGNKLDVAVDAFFRGNVSATAYVGNGSALTGLTKTQVGLGNVQNIDTTNAANISSGTISTARLGSGTADSTTYLRGDSTWQTVPINHTQNTDTGTSSATFQIDTGNTGPKIKNISGVITIRNAADTANAALTASAFTGDGSALTGITKAQVGLGNVANVDTTNAANISSGILPAGRFDDTTHGNRSGGTLHAVATTTVAGFMSAADKTSLGTVASASHTQNTDTGTTATSFQIDTGNTGSRIKNIAGVLTVRNAADGANAAFAASTFTGDGSALTGLTKTQVGLSNVQNIDTTNAANISSGTIGTARLGSGTANSATFLRGDSTWQTIASITHTQNTDTGTTSSTFQIDSGNTGPKIKNVAGVTTIRNAADSANAALTASAFTGDGSALTGLTKGQVGLGNVANVDTTNASNISSGILPAARFDDTTHGNRSGGTLHSIATTTVAGFMSSTDKSSLDTLVANTAVLTSYAATFNATTDWGAASGGNYTITVNHNLNTYSVSVQVWDETTGHLMTIPGIISMPTNNQVAISVPQSPDERFAGRIVILSSGGNGVPSNATPPASIGAAVTPKTFGMSIDGNGGIIATGLRGPRRPLGCNLTNWYVDTDVTTTLSIDVYVNGSLISGTNPMTITNGVTNTNSDPDLTGWTKTIVQGDAVTFNVTSNTAAKNITITMFGI